MAAGPDRKERVLNLLAALLNTKKPMTREQLVAGIAGYPEGESALRRSFERDKELLRTMGVPLRVTTLANGIDQGYHVDPDEYYLPDLGLTAEETAALHIAVSAVELGASAARAGSGALRKLGPADDGAAAGPLGLAAAPIAAIPLAPALPTLFHAVRTRAVLRFRYREVERELEPFGVASARGRWYVVGLDRVRGAIRTFRADRIDPDDVTAGDANAFTVPDGFDAAAYLDPDPWQFGDAELVPVLVRVDAEHRDEFARRAERVVEEAADGSAVVEVLVSHRPAFRSLVLGYGAAVEVLSPPEVRNDIIAWLTATVAS